jgi:hypothetical protein
VGPPGYGRLLIYDQELEVATQPSDSFRGALWPEQT